MRFKKKGPASSLAVERLRRGSYLGIGHLATNTSEELVGFRPQHASDAAKVIKESVGNAKQRFLAVLDIIHHGRSRERTSLATHVSFGS
jgi:hypothetical protein